MSKKTMLLANRHMAPGLLIHKDGTDPADKMRDAGLENMHKELGDAMTLLKEHTKGMDDDRKTLKALADKVKDMGTVDGETQQKLKEYADSFAENKVKMDAMEAGIERIQKEMQAPLYQGGSDLAEKDRQTAIEIQRQNHVYKGGDLEDFQLDEDNLINMGHRRSAMQKMMKGGLMSEQEIRRSMSADEQKAFDAASLDSAFFMPEMLNTEVDCEIEPWSLLDLYMNESVSRSTFMYPHVESYGDIGTYDCDAKCDAEYGPEGNITWKSGQTYDFRGVFCFNRDVLREANYDLLGFMMRAAARSYRINRNQANITGDGVNSPMGWLTADCFTKVAAPQANPTHQDLRQFLASAPVEYGPVVAAMHQNTFSYFASIVDNNGRFIYGDGLMGFGPSNVVDRIRISNYLPDPTAGGTLGSNGAPFATGSFIMAAGVWERAYATVNHRPMFMEQFIGGSSAWCVKYQFGARDGGFLACCPAARTFVAG